MRKRLPLVIKGYRMKISFIILLLFSGLFAQVGELKVHPSSMALRTKLIRIGHAKSPKEIRISDLDSLVSLFAFNEELGYPKYSKQFHSFSDSGYQLIQPAFNNLIKFSKRDTVFIRIIILLEHTIRNNAELAESMPVYVQECAAKNPRGFLLIYQSSSFDERQNILSALDWPSDIDVIHIFRDLSNKLSSNKLRILAKEIADSIHLQK
jgi:hypothetical protein